MARQVLPIAGAIVGSFFGAPQIGFAIGSLIGNAVDPVQIQGPKIGDMAIQTSRDGVPRPIVFGIGAVAGNIIDRSEPRIVKKKERQGKGGGPETTSEHVYMSFAIRVCEGPVTSISRIWENEKLVYDPVSLPRDSTKFLEKVTFYLGDESQLPDPTLEALHGVGNTPAHRGTCYVVYNNKDLTDFGGAIPQYRFEVNGSDFGYDPYASNVVSLLHFNGTDGAVVAYDDVVTTTGVMGANPANNLSDAQPLYGSTVLQLTDVNAGDAPIKQFTTFSWDVDSLFTIEGWFNYTDYFPSSDHYLLFMDINVYGITLCGVTIENNTKYITLEGYGVFVNTTVPMPIGTWCHMAITHDGATLRLFLDGVMIASGASVLPTGNPPLQVTALYGVKRGAAIRQFFGYMDECRITHGVARYTANFTPPTAEFPNP